MEDIQSTSQPSSKASPPTGSNEHVKNSPTTPVETTDNTDVETSDDTTEKTNEGRWGYLIVASVFMANFSLLGWFQTQSFFFVQWKREFNITSVEAALLVSIGLVILGIASPIGSILATLFGNRNVVIVGGCFVSSGMLGTMFMDSMQGIILTWGVMIGIGLGLTYSPSVVMIGQYFDKHFTLANGIAYAGGAVGQIFLPLLSGTLIDVYGWRGTVWLLSAIMCHLIVGGAVLRPKRKRQNVKRTQKIKQKQILNSNVHDNAAFQIDNEIDIAMVTSTDIKTTISTQNNSEATNSKNIHHDVATCPNAYHAYNNEAFQGDNAIKLLSVTNINSPRDYSEKNNSSNDTHTTRNSIQETSVLEDNVTSANIATPARPKRDSSNAPRANVNGNGTSPNGNTDIEDTESNITTLESDAGTTCLSVVKILISNICFDLILIVFFIMGFIFFTPVAHAIPRALASGIDESKAFFLPTTFGIGSLVGRLGPSFMTDCFHIPRDVINISGFVLCTIANILNPYFNKFWLHVVYHLIYGGATGTLTVFTFTLIQIVLQKEHRVFGVGCATLFLCVGDTAGSLLAGWLVDVTGDYDVGSWLLSCLSSIGAILLLIVAIIIRRNKTEDELDKEPVELETLQ